jgi:hypothetical protein
MRTIGFAFSSLMTHFPPQGGQQGGVQGQSESQSGQHGPVGVFVVVCMMMHLSEGVKNDLRQKCRA